MISSERTQNGIVSFVIILALVSSVILVNNVQYYNGSFTLASRMKVSLVSTVVRDIDPTNDSIYPRLAFTFNFRTDAPNEGNVRLNYMDAGVWLNDDKLSFTVFTKSFSNDADQLLHPEYDRNFTISQITNSDADRTAIHQANSTDTWSWFVRLRYNFITFDISRSLTWRILYYNWTGATTIL